MNDLFFSSHYKFLFRGFFIGILLLASCIHVSAQDDNPNLDQLPRSLWDRIIPSNNQLLPASSVITIGNWDNYNLGVDFGESNMAASLSNPAWYFTAYNTNGAHHTENGLDWAFVTPNFGANLYGDPVVAYDSLGNLFYENMYGSGSIQGVKVMRSSDNGLTWAPAVSAASGNDKCWIACDQTSGPNANNVYVCMTNNNAGYFARSTDHGLTWQNTFNPATQDVPGMMVCVGANGNVQGGAVYVVTNSGLSQASVYTFYRSTDGGQTFTMMSAQQFANYVGTFLNNRNSVQGMRTRPYPFIAADNSYGAHRGRLYLVYASNDPVGNEFKPDIWCRSSDDGGTTWTDSVRVNDDANTQNNNQWHPAIWCDKETGRLYVQWMDTRDTPTSDSAYIYATYSVDGGATFMPNQRISNKKMKINCATCGGGGTPRYQGDYNGIVSNNKVAMAGWTDFREGTFMSVTAYFPDFGIALSRPADTLLMPSDSSLLNVTVPEVKLYSDTVFLSATVSPVPTSGTITVNFPSGNIISTFPGSKPLRVILSGNVPLGTYQVIVKGTGTGGTPVHLRNLSLLVLDGSVVNLFASASPTAVCAGGTSQLKATIYGGTPPYTFNWTPPLTLSNPSIANPVATPVATTSYTVSVSDNASHTAAENVEVALKLMPGTPGPISGQPSVCKNTATSHSISLVPFATTYTWSVPPGATLISGQGTMTVTVGWTTTGGDLSVTAGNECGTSAASVKTISVIDPPPAPSLIYGPNSVCRNSPAVFSVDTIPGVLGYYWTVPSGVVIDSGQTTSTIYVRWGLASGEIAVEAQNICGSSPLKSKIVPITPSPGPAGAISGKDTVCMDKGGYVYTVATITAADSYIWKLPTGASITAGEGTQAITIKFSANAVSGDLVVKGANACDTGSSGTKHIVIRNCTGIEDPSPVRFLTVFPNPTTGSLNLSFNEFSEDVEVLVLNTSGQPLLRQKFGNVPSGTSRILELSGFAKGIYYVKVTSKAGFQVEKVAKE